VLRGRKRRANTFSQFVLFFLSLSSSFRREKKEKKEGGKGLPLERERRKREEKRKPTAPSLPDHYYLDVTAVCVEEKKKKGKKRELMDRRKKKGGGREGRKDSVENACSNHTPKSLSLIRLNSFCRYGRSPVGGRVGGKTLKKGKKGEGRGKGGVHNATDT